MHRDDDIDKELQFHIDSRVDDLVASGVAADEARRRARLEFGGTMQIKEAMRDLHLRASIDGLLQDLRLALRTLRATPVVTFVAVLSLALGIGANTAIFSLVDSLILRALPVLEPQRLALVSDARAVRGGFAAGWTYRIWDEMRTRAQPFDDGACAWSTERFNLAEGGGETQPVDGIYASGSYFSTLGVQAVLGRTFTDADDVQGGGKDGPVAVISYALWQRRFGGSGTIVGTSITVERLPFTIIGVMPPGFFGTEIGRAADVALPLATEPLVRGRDSRFAPDRSFYGLTVLLRLKPGQSIDAINETMRGLQSQIREAARPAMLPPMAQKEFMKDAIAVLPAGSGTSRLRTRYERPLVAVFVVVALVLLIACANITNLQLARTAARRHELSIRLALGASRWRLVRQWLVESLVLSAAGAALGLLFASWFSRALVAQLSTAANRVALDLTVDSRVLAFTAVIAVATAILFGTLPAMRAGRVEPIEALKDQGHGSSDARVSLPNGLVIAQVALSLVIVVAAGLFVRTFEKLATLPLGFDSDRVLLVNLSIAGTHVGADNRLQLFDRLVNAAITIPGVAKSAASSITPVAGTGLVEMLRLPGVTPSLEVMKNGKMADNTAYANYITPGFFATYGTPIKMGRDFDARDAIGAPAVIIVNETFVRKFLKGQKSLGTAMPFERGAAAATMKTIVGVVGDATYNGLRADTAPIAYSPLAQFDFPGGVPAAITLSIRAASGAPMLLARSVAAALTAQDHDLTFTFRPMTDQVNASLTQERVVAMLAGFFGALALLLAGLGLYGVTSYTVSRRRTEIGIRMALGAAPGGVVRLVLSRVTLLVALGIVSGAAFSLWASQFVSTLLYGLEPRDPLTLAGSAAVLAAVGAVAGWLPAYRASRIDPAQVLRES